jgi:hypothetical protein
MIRLRLIPSCLFNQILTERPNDVFYSTTSTRSQQIATINRRGWRAGPRSWPPVRQALVCEGVYVTADIPLYLYSWNSALDRPPGLNSQSARGMLAAVLSKDKTLHIITKHSKLPIFASSQEDDA